MYINGGIGHRKNLGILLVKNNTGKRKRSWIGYWQYINKLIKQHAFHIELKKNVLSTKFMMYLHTWKLFKVIFALLISCFCEDRTCITWQRAQWLNTLPQINEVSNKKDKL